MSPQAQPTTAPARTRQAAHEVRPAAVYPAAPNKPNLRRFWPKNADPRPKQTQSNPIGAAILSEAQRSRTDLAGVLSVVERIRPRRLNSQISDKCQTPPTCPVITRAKQTQFPPTTHRLKPIPNKSLPRNGPNGPGEKQSQSKPISGCSLVYSRPHLAYDYPCRAARKPAGRIPKENPEADAAKE